MKQTIILILAIVFAIVPVLGQEFYSQYEVSATHDFPDEVYVEGKECLDTSCSETTNKVSTVYSGEATTCLEQALNGDLTASEFNSCMQNYEISNGIVSMDESQTIITKVELPSSHGYLTYFSAADDQYIPKYVEQSNFVCEFDICIDDNPYSVDFIKKDGAIAEIGQVSIKNTDDPLKPIQVEVPVEIEQTVCSAYTRSLPDAWKPSIPSGFSDFKAETRVSLSIENTRTGDILGTDSVNLAIEADECRGFAAFEWIPDSSLEDEEILFSFTTDVIDDQVINPIQDKAEVRETIYPQNLDNTCWARIEDMTLSNNEGFELDSSSAQIFRGEKLYLSLMIGAFRDEAITPMNYRLEVTADNRELYNEVRSTSSQQLQEESFNLSNSFAQLPPGDYTVTAKATPHSGVCDTRESVEHSQQVTIQEHDKYEVKFTIRDTDQEPIDGANLTLELDETRYDLVDGVEYNKTLSTNASGNVVFEGVIPGDYTYTATKDGFEQRQNSLSVNSNLDVYITMREENQPPVVDLPNSFTAQVNEGIRIDLSNYIYDPNEVFELLNIDARKISGDGSVEIENGSLFVNSSVVGSLSVEVEATDSQGANALDSTIIEFVDEMPRIIEFEATPNDGEAPLDVEFSIDVENADECRLDFGDGNSLTDDCSQLNLVSHTYEDAQTYTAELEARKNGAVDTQTQEITVFEREVSFSIDEFSVTPTQGVAPLDVEFAIQVSNDTLECHLDFGDGRIEHRFCSNMENLSHTYNQTGDITARLKVTDGEDVLIQTRTISVVQSFERIGMNMDVDDRIQAGEFGVEITISNETMQKRDFTLKPRISCSSSTFKLSGQEEMKTSGISSFEKGEDFIYSFKLDTRDFKGVIQKDQQCTLEIIARDEHGRTLLLSDEFRVVREEREEKVESIRGNAVDILGYMSTALQDSSRGVNQQQFRLVNTQDEGRDISISFTSSSIGVQSHVSRALGPGEQRDVSLVYSIPDSVDSGEYPVRITISDGTQTQTRYSYIMIE